jgi:hypothetical protein
VDRLEGELRPGHEVLDLEAEEEAHLELPLGAMLAVLLFPDETHEDPVRLAGEVGGTGGHDPPEPPAGGVLAVEVDELRHSLQEQLQAGDVEVEDGLRARGRVECVEETPLVTGLVAPEGRTPGRRAGRPQVDIPTATTAVAGGAARHRSSIAVTSIPTRRSPRRSAEPAGADADLEHRPAGRGHPLEVEGVVDPVAHLRVDRVVEACDEVGIGLAHWSTPGWRLGGAAPHG